MKIKIFKGECLYSEAGTHVCDERGFAITASEDTEVDIHDQEASRVMMLLELERMVRGLDRDGNPLPPPPVAQPESTLTESAQAETTLAESAESSLTAPAESEGPVFIEPAQSVDSPLSIASPEEKAGTEVKE